MRIGDIMTRNVVATRPSARVQEARGEMRRHGVHHLIVLDGEALVGVLSDRDRPRSHDDRVRDVMAAPVVTATSDTTITEAATILRGHSIGCLPVVEAGRCVGIVTAADLLDWIALGRSST
jgi:acetoin utilization protein AcuB